MNRPLSLYSACSYETRDYPEPVVILRFKGCCWQAEIADDDPHFQPFMIVVALFSDLKSTVGDHESVCYSTFKAIWAYLSVILYECDAPMNLPHHDEGHE